MKILNIIFILLSLVVISSCSSTKTKPNDGEFSWITNEDFNPKVQDKYLSKNDKYDGGLSNDVLGHESLARVNKNKVLSIADSDKIGTATGYCYKREFLKAHEIFDTLYSTNKSNPMYWNQLGTCYYLDGNLRAALLYYNKALDVRKNYVPAINNLGVIYIKNAKDQKAQLAYEQALKYNSRSLTPKFNLAQLYLKYGFIDKAYKSFLDLARENSDDMDVQNGLATCYIYWGMNEKSVKIYEDMDDDFLQMPHIGLNFAVALKKLGKKNHAKEVFLDVKMSKSNVDVSYYLKVKKYIEGK